MGNAWSSKNESASTPDSAPPEENGVEHRRHTLLTVPSTIAEEEEVPVKVEVIVEATPEVQTTESLEEPVEASEEKPVDTLTEVPTEAPSEELAQSPVEEPIVVPEETTEAESEVVRAPVEDVAPAEGALTVALDDAVEAVEAGTAISQETKGVFVF